MSRTKLDVLGYYDPFNADDVTSFRSLVFWLESTKICALKPEERSVLNVDQSDQDWNDAFVKYLSSVGIERSDESENQDIADALLNAALELEMSDIQKEMNVTDTEIAALGTTKTTNSMAKVDVNSPEFLCNLEKLATLLCVPFYSQEPLITLRAIAILLRQLKFKSQQQSTPNQSFSAEMEKEFLDDTFFKNKPCTPELNRVFNLLRLLYVGDLRDLQNTINRIVVQIQTLTANPKTDSSLGKVGM